MRNEGVGSWTARRARKTPGRVAVRHAGTEISYARLHDRVLRLARGLRRLGTGPGDRVGYLGPNHPAFLEAFFATGTAGAVFVPLNVRLAGPELAYQLADSGTTVLICAAPPAATLGRLAAVPPAVQLVALQQPAPGQHDYENLLAGPPPEPADVPVSLADPCLIMYTSGTTGAAKGATLTHGNITWNAINVLVDADFRDDEVALAVAPLFHTAGLNMLCLPTLLKGGTVVIEPAFEPARALQAISQHRVTSMFGVPASYDAMAAAPGWAGADLSSLRLLLCGGAPVPDATIQRYLSRGLTFIQGYGMTEAAPGTLLLDAAHAVSKAGSAGVPHFFTDVRVARPDLAEASPGERGEILVSGPNVMPGYWGRPDATAAVLDAGWLHSGDVGCADADGYVSVVDRIKDMIISGGENIYPAEVENALLGHPAVADCGVIGVPDATWGEVGRAIVVLRPGATVTEAELLGFLDGRLARYKIPKSVQFTQALPRTATGKILKKQLRETHGGNPAMTTTANGLDELTALAGADLGHTGWLEVTQARVDMFADATDDHQWIHVDQARAAAGPFGGTIAHGFLTLSMIIPLFSQLLEVTGISMGINYGLNKVRFPTPVPVGSKIRLAGQLAAVEPAGDNVVQVTADFTVELDGAAKPACVAQGIYRYYA
ncbi:MAG: long-chain-fatty-acid--CoA ligase [Streptosporangiaceae bacterium]